MPLFRSPREKRLWLWVLMVIAAIFLTLFIGQPLARLLANQDIQAVVFVVGMILVGATILVQALKRTPGRSEVAIWLGLTAVYSMFFLRLGIPERSHLIEYSVLAIFIHQALIARSYPKTGILKLASFAFVLTFLVGIIDECIQIALPNRVFDPVDILFNGMAALFAIISFLLIDWIRKKRSNPEL